MSLLDYTAVELAAKIKAGETTATEAMEAVIAQIEKSEDELNCYVTFDKEKALAAAKKADEDIKASFEHGLLPLIVPKKEAKPAVEEKKYITIEG